MKAGHQFIHAVWMDANNRPLRCVVTRVALGWVYWRAVDGGKSYKFDANETHKWVRA